MAASKVAAVGVKREAGYLYYLDKQGDVSRVAMARGGGRQARNKPDAIQDIFVRGRNDTMIPLASVVKLREAVSPRELNHFNQRRSVTITANLEIGRAHV